MSPGHPGLVWSERSMQWIAYLLVLAIAAIPYSYGESHGWSRWKQVVAALSTVGLCWVVVSVVAELRGPARVVLLGFGAAVLVGAGLLAGLMMWMTRAPSQDEWASFTGEARVKRHYMEWVDSGMRGDYWEWERETYDDPAGEEPSSS